MDDKLIGIQDVCNTLGISVPTLWRLRKAGDFPDPMVVGKRRVVWHESQLQEYIDQCKANSRTAR